MLLDAAEHVLELGALVCVKAGEGLGAEPLSAALLEDGLFVARLGEAHDALATVLLALLQTGDLMMSLVGAPYDTMQGVIGYAHETPHSLKEKGVRYEEVPQMNQAKIIEDAKKEEEEA